LLCFLTIFLITARLRLLHVEFIDFVTRPAVASIPSLKSRNYGAPAAPTRCGIASGAPVAVVVVFGGANVDCCGQLAGG